MLRKRVNRPSTPSERKDQSTSHGHKTVIRWLKRTIHLRHVMMTAMLSLKRRRLPGSARTKLTRLIEQCVIYEEALAKVLGELAKRDRFHLPVCWLCSCRGAGNLIPLIRRGRHPGGYARKVVRPSKRLLATARSFGAPVWALSTMIIPERP